MRIAAILLASSLCIVQGAVINNPEDELRKFAVCVQRSGVRPETLRALQFGNFEDDDELKEYLWCISTNTGYQDRAGNLQNDAIRRRMKAGRFNDDVIDDVVQICTRQRETPQETAYQFMKCFYRQILQKKYT